VVSIPQAKLSTPDDFTAEVGEKPPSLIDDH
jgi:hypothetical protein